MFKAGELGGGGREAPPAPRRDAIVLGETLGIAVASPELEFPLEFVIWF